MLKVLLNFELIKCYISSVLCPAELTYGMLFHNDGTVTKAGPAPGVGTPALHVVADSDFKLILSRNAVHWLLPLS